MWTGDVKWLRKVIAHELAHIVHYRAVRSNVGLLSVFFGEPLPSFWAEGPRPVRDRAVGRPARRTAGCWTAVFEDRLSYTDGTSPQNGRLRYAVGNSQVRYLAEAYGDSTIAKILAHRTPAFFGLARVHDFETAFRAVVGKSYADFNEEWRKHVNVYYNTVAGQMERLDSLGVEPYGLPGQVVLRRPVQPGHVAGCGCRAAEPGAAGPPAHRARPRPPRRFESRPGPPPAPDSARADTTGGAGRLGRPSNLRILAEGRHLGADHVGAPTAPASRLRATGAASTARSWTTSTSSRWRPATCGA